MDPQQNIDSPITHTQELIEFTEVAESTEIGALTNPIPLNEVEFQDTAAEYKTHDIANFLARPVRIADFVYNSSHVVNEELISLDFPEAFTTQTNYIEKLAGFYNFRGTLHVDIYSNAQPFQCGLVKAAFIANAQNMPIKASSVVSNITSFSTLPNANSLLPQTSKITVKFPFVSNYTGVNLTSGVGSFGRLAVHAVTPLRVADTSNVVNFTLFVSLQDARFEVPTGAPIHSSFLSSKQRVIQAIQNDKNADLELLRDLYNVESPKTWKKRNHLTGQLQAGAAPSPSVAEQIDIKKSGMITKTALAVAGVASVAALFPALTPFAAPVAVGAAGLAGVFSLFGWSKPTNVGDTSFAKLVAARHMANTNGEDNSHMLSLCANNMLDQDPSIGGTDIDEMAFSVMASTPAVVSTMLWTTIDPVDDILHILPVTPVLSDVKNPDEMAMPMMAYVQVPWTYWSGSMNFIFTIPATPYHKGRLRFTFVPGHYNRNLTGVDINKCHSAILDIQQGNSIAFNIPFVNTADWLYADFGDNFPLNNGDDTFSQGNSNSCVGMLFVTVLNRLVAPDTVSPLLDIVTEVCAGPDMRRAVPRAPPYLPSGSQLAHTEPVGSTLNSNDRWTGKPQDFLDDTLSGVLQSGETPMQTQPLTRNDFQKGKVPPTIGGSETGDPTCFNKERVCIGETLLSVRGLMKRFTTIYESDLPTTADLAILPFAKFSPLLAAGHTGEFDDYSYWSYPFAFARGSVRLKVTMLGARAREPIVAKLLTDRKANEWQQIIALYGATDGPVKAFDSAVIVDRPDSSISQVSAMSIEGTAEFGVPFYNRMHTIPLEINQLPNEQQVTIGNFPPTILRIDTLHKEGLDPERAIVHRAAGDDFSLSFLLGAPLMIKTGY